MHPSLRLCLAGLTALILGSVSLWQLHEDDIYWLIRAGDDILQSWSIPQVETWSYTIQGQPWVNYHWLSQVFLRLVYGIGGASSLVLLRGALITCFFLCLSLIIHNNSHGRPWITPYLTLLLCPAIYISMIFRFHLRPDFFCLLVFTYFMLDLTSKKHHKTILKVPLSWLICLWLSSQWHAGVAVYLGFVIAVLTFFQTFHDPKNLTSWKHWNTLLGSALVIATAYFANPAHFNMIKLLWTHAQYDQTLISNTEYLSFSFHFLNITTHGWPFIIWFCYAICGWLSFCFLALSNQKEWHFQKHPLALFIIGLTFTLLSFQYIRMIPFHLVFFLPFISHAFSSIAHATRWFSPLLYSSVLFIWALPLQSEIRKYHHLWGLQVNEEHFPVKAVKFIQKVQPQGQIFSDFLPGSYQTWALQNYPVFADHRDVIYNSIKPLIVGFQSNPEIARFVEEKYGIYTALLPIHKNRWASHGQLTGGLDYILPPELWSIVFFSNQYVVLVKNISDHKNLIDTYRYEILNPAHPIHLAMLKIQGKPSAKEQLQEEVRRCLKDVPHHIYCTAIQSELFLSDNKVSEAIETLENIKDLFPKKNTDILIQLWKAYTKSQNKEKADEIDQILQERFSK